MRYELNVTMHLDSDQNQDRVAKLFESLFEFGTIRESIAEGLQLLDDPRLLAVDVTRATGGEMSNSASAP
jgi:hypothetical protein